MNTPIRRIALGFTTAATLGAAVLAAGAASAQTVLRYSSWLPPKHTINAEVLMPWAAEVQRVTAGRVKVDVLPKAVASPPAQFDVINDGLADLGVILPGYNAGRFPLMELGELPLLSSDVTKLAPAFYRIYKKHLEAHQPFKGTHVITVFATTPNQLVTRAAPVNTLGDLKGLKLRAPSRSAVELIDALGAVALQKPVSEMYELASTGIVDGTLFAATAVSDWKLGKVLPFMTLVDGGVGQPVMAFLVNAKVWNGISKADRDAIMAVSGEQLAATAGRQYGDHEKSAREKLAAEGAKIIEGSPALQAELRQRLSALDDAWIAKAKASGLQDPRAVLDEFRQALK
ncbi:MAG: TRAP transporter substrate-binding protein [Lautropia sp.]